jgi:hypothetical protein
MSMFRFFGRFWWVVTFVLSCMLVGCLLVNNYPFVTHTIFCHHTFQYNVLIINRLKLKSIRTWLPSVVFSINYISQYIDWHWRKIDITAKPFGAVLSIKKKGLKKLMFKWHWSSLLNCREFALWYLNSDDV